jgi:hypothetical protein
MTEHIMNTFSEIKYKFPVSGHSYLDIYRDFGVTEKRKRKVPHAHSPEWRYKLMEIASKKKVFAVIRMKDKGFVSVVKVQQKLVF